jgi:hypothetical protein
MKPRILSTARLSFPLTAAIAALLIQQSAQAQTWANSNITATPTAILDWFSGGPNTQATWTGGTPISSSGTTVTFYRAQNSIGPKTNTTIEVGTDLLNFPSQHSVPDLAAANNPGVTVEKNNPAVGTDKITLRVVKAPDTKKFARLKVAITP